MSFNNSPYRLVSALVIITFACADSIAEDIQYNRDIRPILAEYCFKCHGPDERDRKADLRLDDADAARNVFQFTSESDSKFIQRIASADTDERMPPAESGKQLTGEQIARLTDWARTGAPYEEHWAFIPPAHPKVPVVADSSWPVNAIDHFVLRRMNEQGLSPSTPADRATLIRRLALDLTGLPPTPQEVDAFLADTRPNAYEHVVDRLLASRRYGEHMALGWMEAARYADTDGYQNDRLRDQFVWRDWVIQSFNENLPYDTFVIEQLAGDMLHDATLRQQIASGFNRNHRINSENGSIPAEWQVENVFDRTETVGTLFLGLTFNCARCHDHKFDPISQREYYGLFAHFNNVPEWGVGPNNGNSPPFIEVPESWPYLGEDEDHAITPDPYELNTKQGGVQRPQRGSPDSVMVMHEMDEPRTTYVLRRGVYSEPDTSEAVIAHTPQVLMAPGEPSPTNRLELARWLVDGDHPLTARVAVNRYWQHFFGVGLVTTPDNFGLQGAYPSHPELLDWLATEFVDIDWNVKALQKQIVMSATYRQTSRTTPDAIRRDPENRFLARAPRIRLTGQQLRDQALFASGLLVERVGGRSVKPYMPPGLWESLSNATYDQGHGEDLYRRSLYTYWRRTTPPPVMTGFNAADRETCTVKISRTHTPLHALTLMNNITFVESARILAERMLDEGDGLEGQVRAGFRYVLSRAPSSQEREELTRAFEAFLVEFTKNGEGAEALLATGEKARSGKFDSVYLASMTMVASAILNLDEAIMRY